MPANIQRSNRHYATKYYVDWIQRRVGLGHAKVAKAISLYHELAREDIASGESMPLGSQLGILKVIKQKREIKVDEHGNIQNHMPIDWRNTWKLWKEHPELRHKTHIRYDNSHSNNYQFKLRYSIGTAKFPFKKLYTFYFNQTLKRKLSQNIKAGKTDAFEELYKF